MNNTNIESQENKYNKINKNSNMNTNEKNTKYANKFYTKNRTEYTSQDSTQKTLCILKPYAMEPDKYKSIITKIIGAGFIISYAGIKQYERYHWEDFYKHQEDNVFFEPMCNYLHNKKVTLLILIKDDAITCLRDMLGPTNPKLSKPEHLRYEFAELDFANTGDNGIHASDSKESYKHELNCLFGRRDA